MSVTYYNPTRRLFKERALESLPDVLGTIPSNHILLVLGKRSFRRSPDYQTLLAALKGRDMCESLPVEKPPTLTFIQTSFDQIKSRPIDAVIGVGGGSVLDTAKTLAALYPQSDPVLSHYFDGTATFEKKALPCITIPTTSGSGSEVTQYASLETESKQKLSLAHPELFAHTAIIDPALTYSMPAYLTASTGLDALSQAIEAFWARSATPFSDPHATRAIPLILESLDHVVQNPNDEEGRKKMSLASLEAGIAISQTRTTAVHSVSYPITTYFLVPHGHACALTLSAFLKFNEEALGRKKRKELQALMSSRSLVDAAKSVDRLMDSVGLARRLSSFGIDRKGIEKIVEHGFRPDRVTNNPRNLTAQELNDMLLTLL